jgi:uncharacterized protein with HEPN domain
MYEDIERFKSIVEKIEAIETIISETSITKALEDKVRDRPAILMHLVAMAEQFDKLKKHNSKLLNFFDEKDLKGSYNIRNFIAHDYEGVSLSIIEAVIREQLPKIKNIISESILKEI